MISEKEYHNLCATFNKLLLESDSTLEMVSIPWLHIIREHPIVLEKYKSLFLPNSCIRNTLNRSFNLLVWFRQVIRAIYSDGKPWFGSEKLPKNLDVLFISHLLTPSHYLEKDDFYFTNIPERLDQNGKSVALARISHFGGHRSLFNDSFKSGKIPRIYLSETLSLKKEIILRLRLKKESRRLKALSQSSRCSLKKNILNEAAIKVLGGSTQTNLRLHEQIKSLVEKTNPKLIITLYEGHAYERIIFSSARCAKPDIRCIAYQHTGTFRLSNAIRQILKPEYNPDVILTSGLEGKLNLEKALKIKELNVSVFGSIRGIMENSINKHQELELKRKRCLVLPEGFESECMTLLGFSLECAKFNPEIEFIWRLHPSISFMHLKTKYSSLRKLPKNIIFSNRNLEEDIVQSSWVLYRGTTAVFKAISGGLRPIYLKKNEEISIDPLYTMENWKVEVSTISDFNDCVKFDIEKGLIFDRSDLMTAKKVCENKFANIDLAVLEDLIM
jgi:hypothetical protein